MSIFHLFSRPDASRITDQKSLRIRFIIFFSTFIGIIILVTALNTIQQIYDVTFLINARMGLPIAQRAVAMIDGDAFERLAATMDPEDPYYDETRQKLLDYKMETGCLYLYTIVPYTDAVHRFVIDGSAPPGDVIFSPLGSEEPVEEYDEAYLRTYQEKTPQFSKIFFQVSWGVLISTFVPIFNSQGDMVGVLGCDFDATSIRDTIKANIIRLALFVIVFIGVGFLLYRSMLNTIIKQNMELMEMNQKVLAANRTKSDFLARTSHEIRTPMNAIIGMSELAQREYGGPKALEYITGIKTAGASLLAIINDILDFSKIESGRLPMVPAPYGTAAILNDVLAVIRVRMESTPLELIVDAPPDLPSAMVGDVGRVKQVLLNLLSNAVKYTRAGFVKFSVSGQAVGDHSIRLSFVVEDSGIGIRERDLPKLFDEFSRIDEKRNSGIEGTGLGLVIARSLCRAMDGDIEAKSVFGRGSVFTATIEQQVTDWRPMGDLSALAASRIETQRASFTAPEAEVLVVDDFPSNLLVAEGLLAPYAVRVTTCLNGREAVELVRGRPFDLVLMDHMMPEMDGVEATAIIRAMEGPGGSTPIVALTANAVSGMREMFLGSGFDDFISKPIDTATLDEALTRWIPEAKRLKAADGWPAPESRQPPESAAPPESARPAGPPEPRLPVIAGVDSSAGLARVGGSPGRYLDLLDLFCRDAASVAPLLEAVPDGAALPAFTTTVHALKSALANIGAERLSQAAGDLERAGREADMPLIVRGLPAFREELATLTIRIRQGAGGAPGPPGGDGAGRDRPEIAAASAELRKALEARDLDAVDAALERLRESAPAGEARRAVSEIADFILTADFQQALEALAALSDGTG